MSSLCFVLQVGIGRLIWKSLFSPYNISNPQLQEIQDLVDFEYDFLGDSPNLNFLVGAGTPSKMIFIL